MRIKFRIGVEGVDGDMTYKTSSIASAYQTMLQLYNPYNGGLCPNRLRIRLKLTTKDLVYHHECVDPEAAKLCMFAAEDEAKK